MHPKLRERELPLAAQGVLQAALKEEEGAHTLLRGARNIIEGFEVDRANQSSLFSIDLCSTSKDHFFLLERVYRSVQKDLQRYNPLINPSLMIGLHNGYIRVYTLDYCSCLFSMM